MSHEEPRRVLLPSRLGDVAPASSLDYRTERYAEPARRPEPIPGPRRTSSWEGFGRAIRRHWWQILPLWLLASGALWFYLPRWFPNSFEASSEIQAEGGTKGSSSEIETLMQTQASRIRSPKVVDDALISHADLASQLVTPEQPNAQVAIRNGLSAEVQPKTHLIRVAMTAPRDDGLAKIVDGVIEAFLIVATDFQTEGSASTKAKLNQLMRAKEDQVKKMRQSKEKMVLKNGNVDAEQARQRHAAAIDQYTDLSRKLQETEVDIVSAQASMEQIHRDETDRAKQPRVVARPNESDAIRAFYLTPEVAALKTQQDEAARQREVARVEATKASDANRTVLQKRADDLQVRVDDFQKQINLLWAKLSPGLMVNATASPPGEVIGPTVTESSRIEARINGLKASQGKLTEQLDKLKQETLAGGADVLQIDFLQQDLNRSETVLGTMTQSFHEAEVDAAHPVARFRQEYPAQTVERSAARERWALGIAGPGLILFTLLGFFSLIERRVGRILDPADLPSRARLNVIGMVPPLPKGRGRIGLDAPSGKSVRSEADLERFIQSLDQLRVLVCGRGDASGRPRRSLLITSAAEGEGKSTLAAQLAERSVSAGLLTLLIDADLRNPTLSRMFDRPESVGLANVLRGELMAEEAISTVTEAGGFHFLAAGQVRDDLSRLLASDKLARLLESARESFDLVLVDSPPVLPVADALTIGQWVDGAVLTVRHKSSRLPLVERAAQQLASVGVTVLGAVVNGVRDKYAPYYGPRPEAGADRSTPAGSVF